MGKKEDVLQFLQDFKAKAGVWGIIFPDERPKNVETLLELDITSVFREKILKEIELQDYSEGPLDEKLYGGSAMWVFGKMIKGHEVYIKISYGLAGAQVFCISFHIAEYAMKYPFK